LRNLHFCKPSAVSALNTNLYDFVLFVRLNGIAKVRLQLLPVRSESVVIDVEYGLLPFYLCCKTFQHGYNFGLVTTIATKE